MKLFFYSLLVSLFFGRAEISTNLTIDSAAQKSHQQKKTVTYYVHPLLGNDENPGNSKALAFKTLAAIAKLKLNPGDRVILASDQTYPGSLQLINQQGSKENPIIITSADWNNKRPVKPALINFKSRANGILIQDCSFINISDIGLTGNGFNEDNEESDMRCAVLVNNKAQQIMTDVKLDHLFIKDVYYENPGFVRGAGEVKSANGTQRYGWGIRITNTSQDYLIENVQISDCEIAHVSHTGIKLTGKKKNITRVSILNNRVKYTGGPGIQMSEVENVYVANNIVDHSGSNDDSRKWGRGSGLWTWGSTNVLIEKNKFLFANGPGDSNGAHIDYNCTNVVIQYNFSYHNAGGFCEILGNNYNCVYRYNISVNDGYRVKGKNGAFQEGKILWLSGYQGEKQKRKGPVNTYIYNNTIFTDSALLPKVAFDNTSQDVLIANNIFYLVNPFQMVLGDQNKPDVKNNQLIKNMQLKNNLFFKANSLPDEMSVYETGSFIGDPLLKSPGGFNLSDYYPLNSAIVKGRGIKVTDISLQLKNFPFEIIMKKDIVGKLIPDQPCIGAIEP